MSQKTELLKLEKLLRGDKIRHMELNTTLSNRLIEAEKKLTKFSMAITGVWWEELKDENYGPGVKARCIYCDAYDIGGEHRDIIHYKDCVFVEAREIIGGKEPRVREMKVNEIYG